MYGVLVLGLSGGIAKGRNKALTKRNILRYRKDVSRLKKTMRVELEDEIKRTMKATANLGQKTQRDILRTILDGAGVEYSKEVFDDMFKGVSDSVIDYIVSNKYYGDFKTLSSRIWRYGSEFEGDIQYLIDEALREGKSAIELARDLEEYVKEPAKRASDWGKAYPHLKYKQVDYNAQRLARTSINHSYQESSKESASRNPFVEGMKWLSAYAHGRTCQLCMDRAEEDRYGMGAGIFPLNEVPVDHPNGLCSLVAFIPQSLDKVAEELNDWLHGGDNNKLDDWYDIYGLYFANKKG